MLNLRHFLKKQNGNPKKKKVAGTRVRKIVLEPSKLFKKFRKVSSYESKNNDCQVDQS